MKVRVYSTPKCVHCKSIKEYLIDNKIEFDDVDVSIDDKEAQFMIEKTQQMSVPVVQIGNEFVIGFDKLKIDILLGLI